MINVLIDTSPLANANSLRGVGVYTRMLVQSLNTLKGITVLTPVDIEKNKKLKKSIDLIHYPFFDLYFSTLPLRTKKPTVVTVHDVIPLIFPEQYKPGVKGKVKFVKQKNALQNVETVITDSQTSKNDIVKYLGVKSEKIAVIYLAANPDLKKPPSSVINRVRRHYKLPKNYILYVGDINYNKNLPQLIKALKFLPREIKLVCLGKNFQPQNIPEWQWIETQMAMSDVVNRVKFITGLGSDANQELSAIYAAAAVYVQPSLYEGFGLPVLEAMQCRTPVIATQNSSLIEVGGEGAVFCQPEAESIAAQVETVLSWSKNKRSLWVKNAYNWSQKFSWQKTAQQTFKIYKQVITKA